jgi:hypothetical protein
MARVNASRARGGRQMVDGDIAIHRRRKALRGGAAGDGHVFPEPRDAPIGVGCAGLEALRHALGERDLQFHGRGALKTSVKFVTPFGVLALSLRSRRCRRIPL